MFPIWNVHSALNISAWFSFLRFSYEDIFAYVICSWESNDYILRKTRHSLTRTHLNHLGLICSQFEIEMYAITLFLQYKHKREKFRKSEKWVILQFYLWSFTASYRFISLHSYFYIQRKIFPLDLIWFLPLSYEDTFSHMLPAVENRTAIFYEMAIFTRLIRIIRQEVLLLFLPIFLKRFYCVMN